MAHNKFTYQEIRDELHIFNNEEFNLLERKNEFPNVFESFLRLKKVHFYSNKNKKNVKN